MKYLIIGVGAAGITAAKTIREQQPEADITMISTDNRVHSRCMLHHYLSLERTEETLSFVPQDFFQTQNIQWISGMRVTTITPKEHSITLENGKQLVFDKLLIATGANSFIPPVGDFRNASNVFGLRNLSDAQAINQLVTTESKVLIVGSGLVGLDAAYAFLRRNMSVTIVEMVDKILPLQLDDRAAGAYQKLFEEAGCKFLLNKKATTTTMSGNKITQVVLDDGTALECDLVIVAAGVRPAIECIASAAIEGERKVDVNAHLQTNHPDIYAAGDVAGLSGIWPNAMKQGKIAAMNMCGNSVLYEDCYAMKNTINFYGLTTLSLGKTTVEEGDEVCICEERTNYKKAIFRNGKLRGIILQGDIRYCGIYQYLIKNEMDLKELSTQIFHLSFAEFFHVAADGEYRYSC